MRYLARRGGLFLITLWAALTVNFIIPRVMPGNEASAVLATFKSINPAALHALEIQFGTGHQNILSSYFGYLGNCFTGQFGVTAQGVPVSQVVWMICLVRENLWEYLQKHAQLERPAEIFGELELLEMLDKFFHLAIYYAALGHERATAGYSVKREVVSA